MNALYIGVNKEKLVRDLAKLDEPVLIIDDGSVIDQLSIRARRFDPLKHSLNPLKDISYRTACDFVSIIESSFPGGENTLTKQNTSMQLLTALSDNPRKLSTLITDTKETKDAYNKIQRVLLSPVLKPILTRSPSLNFSMKGTIIARLNRAELGDFDCRFLGNLIASHYPGRVVITDFGFYQSPFHTLAIQQERLVAGVSSLAELPEGMRNELLVSARLVPSRCTYEDATKLAEYLCDHIPHSNEWNAFVSRCMERFL